MVCKWCGGDVDDPFWDDECPECQHELYHNTGAGFEPSCGDCLAEAERLYEDGYRFDGERWVEDVG